MVKANWDIFKSKFSENPQENFEWFCYLLFCKEHHLPLGIFRFKNQSAIETDPIKSGDKVIGWQAKFYDNSLSNHKDDFIKSLEKAKRDYPQITTIIFYSNKSWSQNKGKTPKGLTEIEKKAKDKGIEISWRVESYFESEFVAITNEKICSHFFTHDNSLLDLVSYFDKHTDNILAQIKTSFTFQELTFEIDRKNDIEILTNVENKIIILSGVGGVGKTVAVKKMASNLDSEIPFYLFKATEFNINSINEIFNHHSIYDFLDLHKSNTEKYVVIDSAEKLIDLTNDDPFKELLTALIKDNWNIIFTTRNDYLENLNYQFFEIFNIAPKNIPISLLAEDELENLSKQYSFNLPEDTKLRELIKTPFYLNEYLKFYTNENQLQYSEFKKSLWNRKIKGSNPLRENCFLTLAHERAKGGFYVSNPSCENSLITELIKEGVLGHETGGYFISHDIYEEWALERLIENAFLAHSDAVEMFTQIGEFLPIRRSFRSWLSEKLFNIDGSITIFIEEVFDSNDIQNLWKDEVYVSVLLSEYSERFFDEFKKELLEKDRELLIKFAFILRIACKEVNQDFYKQIGVNTLNIFKLGHVMTKPKGHGWSSLINFVYDNISTIGIENTSFILPVIHDWTNHFKSGTTTKNSGLIALKFYEWSMKTDVYFSGNDLKKKLIDSIMFASSEIKGELEVIFQNTVQHKWINHRDPYYDLNIKILAEPFNSFPVVSSLPEKVMLIAESFWFDIEPDHDDYSYRSGYDHYFGIRHKYELNAYPSSAYQTPIYWLLTIDLQKTIDFILRFVNKSIICYAESGFDSTVTKVKVYFDEDEQTNQYISHCLWNMYRGTSSPVSPYLLQSIHMALEKKMLEIAKDAKTNVLESWLIYLLKQTNSASISSVVASIVLAYPEKTFNVAKVLFKTKEFIESDTTRIVSDQGAKSLYSIGSGLPNGVSEIHQNERLKTCEDKHRKWSLENQFLNYQTFREETISDEDSEKRQKELWAILDNYYSELPPKKEQSDSDLTWRMFLSRMDRRKMNISTEVIDEGVAIQFNPNLEPELKKYSEDSIDSSEYMKHSSLMLWANYRFEQNEKYKEYPKYESDPCIAIKEIKEIISELKVNEEPDSPDNQDFGFDKFKLFNLNIPAKVCCVLIRCFSEKLSNGEKIFCCDLILEKAFSSINPNYQYQLSDGVQEAFSTIPNLLEIFPKKIDDFKSLLLLSLFNEFNVGGMSISESSIEFPAYVIRKMWIDNFNDAQSLVIGYMMLKPQFIEYQKNRREELYEQKIYQFDNQEIFFDFIKKNESLIDSVIDNTISSETINKIENYDLSILLVTLKMLPNKIVHPFHKKLVNKIITTFANEILNSDRDDRINFTLKNEFFKKYTYIVLCSDTSNIKNYIELFITKFNNSENIADLFNEFILSEDNLNEYDKFWIIWELFKGKVFELGANGDSSWHTDTIIKSFLFSRVPWRESVDGWHTLKDREKRFFKEVSIKLSHCPSALYALAKLLNDIGCKYINEGVIWLSTIIKEDPDLMEKKLETNTIYHLENFSRKFIYKNRELIKKNRSTKNSLLIVLDFLVLKGSAIGYMLRENIA